MSSRRDDYQYDDDCAGDMDDMAIQEPVGMQAPAAVTDVAPVALQQRKIHMEISGSMEQFRADPARASETIAAEVAKEIFGDGQTSRVNNAVLRSATLSNVKNTFPVAIGLQITGVEGAHLTPTGDRFAHVAKAESVSNEAVVISEKDIQAHLDFARQYPNFSHDNVRSQGTHHIRDEAYHLVNENHPMIGVLRENAAQLQTDINSCGRVDGKYFKVGEDVWNNCMTSLEQQLKNEVSVVDLSNFKITAKRVNKQAWDDYDTITGDVEVFPGLMQTPQTISCDVTLEYVFMNSD